MTRDKFTLTIHMVSSLDGMVAKKDNSVSWFNTSSNFENGIDAQNPEEFLSTIDCYIMGSRTYEHALELSKSYGWAYGDKPTIVLSARSLPVERTNVEFYSGDLHELMERLRSNYRNAWVVGGPSLAKNFIRLGLADEIRVSILPIILGEGTLFFDHVGQEHPLILKEVSGNRNGMVELRYEIRK